MIEIGNVSFNKKQIKKLIELRCIKLGYEENEE